MDIHECYQVLGLSLNASDIEIKTAYLALAKQNHPDLFTDAIAKQVATETFTKINEAYQTINARQKTTFGDTKNNQAKLFYNFGVYSAENEELKDANYYFSQAIKLDPSFGKAYFYRGIVLEKQGFNLRAESDFNKYYELKTGIKTNNIYSSKVEFKKPLNFKFFKVKHIIIGMILIIVIPFIPSIYKTALYMNKIVEIIESQNLSDEELNNIENTFNFYGGNPRAIQTGLGFCQYLEDKISLSNKETMLDGMPTANVFVFKAISDKIGEIFVGGSIPYDETESIEQIGMAINLSAITHLCPQYINLYEMKKD